MKYALPLIAAAGLATAYYDEYTILEGRSDLADYEPQLTLIARALESIDADLAIREAEAEPNGSRRGSTASIEMQPLSRTSSWSSMHAAEDSHGKKLSSGVGRQEGDNRDASRGQQAVNAAQRGGSYAKKNPAEAASSAFSSAGSFLGAAGAISGASGNAAGAAACGAGAAGCNAASNLIDKYAKTKKGAKGKRDLMARALMAEIAMNEYAGLEARSYDDDLWADEFYY
ncbi:MAG: hypothetical protein GOMPHAMPRED_006775 [Gomphillus americanus]|uniref:Uncharacterized protein n=1 Tax=Gomphillus americanus TaxID=1940652 RepID=A0A8H3EN18_9LECA|nr:MAG: hypothetical protein GOMPHAMPRED_006775 [Gomphillus americanus]